MTIKGYLESGRELFLPEVPVSARQGPELAPPEHSAVDVLPRKGAAYKVLIRRSSRVKWSEHVSLHPLSAVVCLSVSVVGIVRLNLWAHLPGALLRTLLAAGFVFWGQRFLEGDWPKLAFFKSAASFALLSIFLPVWWRWTYSGPRPDLPIWALLAGVFFTGVLLVSVVLVPAAFVAAGVLGLWLRLQEWRAR